MDKVDIHMEWLMPEQYLQEEKWAEECYHIQLWEQRKYQKYLKMKKIKHVKMSDKILRKVIKVDIDDDDLPF